MFVLFFNFIMLFLPFFSILLEKTTFLFEAIVPPQKISVTQATSYLVYFNNGILVSFFRLLNKLSSDERFKCRLDKLINVPRSGVVVFLESVT